MIKLKAETVQKAAAVSMCKNCGSTGKNKPFCLALGKAGAGIVAEGCSWIRLLKNTALVALKSAPAKSQARTGMKAKLTKYTYVNGVGQRQLGRQRSKSWELQEDVAE